MLVITLLLLEKQLLYEPYSKPPQVDWLRKLRLRANSSEGTRQTTDACPVLARE